MRWLKGILAAAVLLMPAAVRGDEKAALGTRLRMLESELELAKQTKGYFIFDLEEKSVQLKIRGVPMRSFSVEKALAWGGPVPPRPMPLVRKTALEPPVRPQIVPGEAEKKEGFELNALELEDMPTRYTLDLDDGVFISVREKPSGFWGHLAWGLERVCLSLARPLRTISAARRKKVYTSVILIMEPREAKALYWAFPEGSRAIVSLRSP